MVANREYPNAVINDPIKKLKRKSLEIHSRYITLSN